MGLVRLRFLSDIPNGLKRELTQIPNLNSTKRTFGCLFGQMLRRIWPLPVPSGLHSDCGCKIWGRGRRFGAVSEKSLRGSKRGSSNVQKRAVGTPLISLGSTLVANSLCPGQEKHTKQKAEV
jgi:hypothetical protein